MQMGKGVEAEKKAEVREGVVMQAALQEEKEEVETIVGKRMGGRCAAGEERVEITVKNGGIPM